MKTNLKVEFKVFNTNAKGEVSIGLVLKGGLSDSQILALHHLKAVGAVFVDIFDGQASIEDYEHDNETSEPYRGVTYSMDNGTVQLSIDDLAKAHKDIKGEPLQIDADANIIQDEKKGDLEEELPF